MTQIPQEVFRRLRQEAIRRNLLTSNTVAPVALQMPYQEWIRRYAPHVASSPMAQRHTDLWEWFAALRRGQKVAPRLEVWPRGGAKSSSGEMGCAYLGMTLQRQFALYCCNTQDQADKHVMDIASLFSAAGEQPTVRQVGRRGMWNRQQLRTVRGFNVAAIGLDKAVRGIKVEQYRPDIIFFDDIDDREDTLKTIEKKIDAITGKIMLAGSTDCVYLFLQNYIHDQSIMFRLVEGTAGFLANAQIGSVEPAVYGLEYELRANAEGRNLPYITAGRPSWEGQSLEMCETLLQENEKAFLEECQHLVSGAKGYVFDVAQFRTIKPNEIPTLVSICLAGDLAATEGGGDYTVYLLLGKSKIGQYYILAVIRGQWSPDRVQGCWAVARNYYKRLYPHIQFHLPQDPGAAGKILAFNQRRDQGQDGLKIDPVTGSKATRARGAAKETNRANVFLVEQDLPEVFRDYIDTEGRRRPLIHDLTFQTWHREFKAELRSFREDELDQIDDQVDAFSDGYNHLSRHQPSRVISKGKVN